MTNKTKNLENKIGEMTKQAQVGDIIRSEKFAFGYYDSFYHEGYLVPQKDRINVNGAKEYPVQFRKPGTPWDKPAEYLTVDLGAYDESRSKDLFVVEKAAMTGGGSGFGGMETYPDGWYVEARRLNENGTYNPNGEIIKFYQSEYFTNFVPVVEVVRKMVRKFIWSTGKPKAD